MRRHAYTRRHDLNGPVDSFHAHFYTCTYTIVLLQFILPPSYVLNLGSLMPDASAVINLHTFYLWLLDAGAVHMCTCTHVYMQASETVCP